jgi:hypothetical protein
MLAEPILPIRPALDPAPAGPVEQPPAAESAGKARTDKGAEREARVAAALAAAGGPLAVDSNTAAAMCGLGRATFFRARSAGKTPAPVRILGKVLYLVSDLKLWAALGFCDRRTFEAHKNASGRPSGAGR